MNVTVSLKNEAYYLEAATEEGLTVSMDAGEALGGEGKGPRPMQLVLAALGGCSSIDVLSILRKQRQPVDAYRVEVEGQRVPGVIPSVFTDIHVHYVLGGAVEAAKVRRAIELSMDKYCSVTRMLEPTVTITYSFSLNGERYEGRHKGT